MKDGTLQPIVNVCLSCSMVWTRNAKAPDTALHPLTQVRIPTGTSGAIRQKAYPIPHKCVKAVRAEIDGLLKAGLTDGLSTSNDESAHDVNWQNSGSGDNSTAQFAPGICVRYMSRTVCVVRGGM
eukprot:590120-Pleurochrysis_carterae.AAC.2